MKYNPVNEALARMVLAHRIAMDEIFGKRLINDY